MPLKTPAFWQNKNNLAMAFLPLSYIYLLAHRIKTALSQPYKSAIPVLCIGGVVAGGSGKTPIVHALVALVRKHSLFENPVILTRGYGGALKGPTLVDLSVHNAADVGDEAMLHAAHAPTIVAANRAQGAMLAEAMDADLILMDDGFQNNSLAKDLSFLVIDGQQGIGNGYCLPAGPLREPLHDALTRCSLIIQTNGFVTLRNVTKPLAKASLHLVSSHDKSKPYVAFCGLGYPEKFRNTLEQNGFRLQRFVSFSDHHPYSRKDIESLKTDGLPLITTEKDFARVPAEDRDGIDVLRIEQTFDTPEDVVRLLGELRR